MEANNHRTKLTMSELGNLWSQYMNDTMAVCVLRYFLSNVQDEKIKEILAFALGLSELHINKIKQFLSDDEYSIPVGFTDEDVNPSAPPLFSDTFFAFYLHIMAIHGLTRYSGSFGSTMREDQRNYLSECITETLDLYNRSTALLLEKGIISKPPTLNGDYKPESVKKENWLTGWFSTKRPINAIELGGVYLSLQKTMMKEVLQLGFSQVAQSKEVREFLQRGLKLCRKHNTVLSSFLQEEDLHAPRSFASEITKSTIPPFSDKLMLNHVSLLIAFTIGFYGESLSVCQRRDLSVSYARMATEVGLYAEDGANILIENGWMEQPPLAIDHQKLAREQ
ncbi:DUF3231 family protein [Peribacillus deserti]|uniref:Transcriptional regulator n=1 Tax=Peribacillus deserti TaxID=673318 RepID=A0A2N5M0M3_9BACI|nr:DUF3231 family protein [Peribacillus deserti]PLT27908.1 transcriptional regulator [Peribacillus deserti]